jgi:hypothetical protein
MTCGRFLMSADSMLQKLLEFYPRPTLTNRVRVLGEFDLSSLYPVTPQMACRIKYRK